MSFEQALMDCRYSLDHSEIHHLSPFSAIRIICHFREFGENRASLAENPDRKRKGRPRWTPYVIEFIGGDEGDRTPDLMNAIHALSQLSYVPVAILDWGFWIPARSNRRNLNLAKYALRVKGIRCKVQSAKCRAHSAKLKVDSSKVKWTVHCSLCVLHFALCTDLSPFEFRLALLEKCADAFLFVVGREADREKVDLAAEAFVEVRSRCELDGLLAQLQGDRRLFGQL